MCLLRKAPKTLVSQILLVFPRSLQNRHRYTVYSFDVESPVTERVQRVERLSSLPDFGSRGLSVRCWY